ncbi:MAG: hypothetical protein OEL77_02090 [Nitrosopumilus sp.]|nr:hypothetical protein [Nitrosopumilus sp.]MDH3384787.1 hypothetical protein [Nitrosopumilus sp.]
MNKSLTITAITLIAVAMGFSAIAPAIAVPATVQGLNSGALDHNGAIVPVECHEVIANNAKAKGTLTCTGTATEPFPDKAVKMNTDDNSLFPGVLCGTTSQGATADWQTVITPSGNLKLVCHFP